MCTAGAPASFLSLERLLLILAPALLLMRLGRPRPSLGALVRQPGAVACLAVVFGFVWITGWLHRLFFGRIDDWIATAIAVGGSVAVAWVGLALTGRWTSEPSWIDRLGRLLGATAIVVAVVSVLVFGI
jgi:hypothetical protein